MVTRGWVVPLSLSLVACGGALGDSATSTESDSGGHMSDASPAADSSTGDSTRPSQSTGVVWIRAEASSFDPRACAPPSGTDFMALGDYIQAEVSKADRLAARVSLGNGVCAFGTSPTTMTRTDVFAATVAGAQALQLSPPAPFHGTFVTVPLVVKDVLKVKFDFFVGADATHVFDSVWVHEGLNFADEAAFMADICNEKDAFDAAIVTSPLGAAVKTWLRSAAGPGYRLGYDATFYFADGTSTTVANASQAAGGPSFAPCPNMVSP